MIVIKLGGSIFAPKLQSHLDLDYLNKFKIFLDYIDEQIIFTHGTGNRGHGFVKKYGVSRDTFPIWKDIAKIFFQDLDNVFGYVRLKAEDILKGKEKIPTEGNVIIGGDIDSETLRIISSDEIVPFVVGQNNVANSYMLTDVDGVLDSDNNIIPVIEIENADKIKFWSKEGDYTNGMLGKIQSIKQYIPTKGNNLFIINGYDLENAKKVIFDGVGKGTKVIS